MSSEISRCGQRYRPRGGRRDWCGLRAHRLDACRKYHHASIGYILAGVDFSSLAVTLPTPTGDGVTIKYGVFLNAIIKFLITAAAIFLLVRAINAFKKPAAAAPSPPTPSEIYLKEIRDALVKREGGLAGPA